MKYSIIIPVFNESNSVQPLFDSLKRVMDSLKDDYEIIFINDGSIDGTLERLETIAKVNPNSRIINFPKNKGQGKALEEGFRQARGEIIITMDGDLQNDPEDIPALISKINAGFDLVCGWRYNRKDNLIKRLKSKIGNFMQRKITRLKLYDMSCTFRAYRSNIVKGITLNRKYDFSLLPYIITQRHNIKIAQVEISHRERKMGESRYRLCATVMGTIYSYCRLVLKFRKS